LHTHTVYWRAELSLRGCTVVSQNVWDSISLKLNKLRSLLQNMIIGHKNWSLILGMHRRQTSRLGTFKCKLSLVLKTSCIKLKFTCVEVNRLFWWMWREIKSISANLYLFYICMTTVPFQRDIKEIKKMHTHTVYWRAELSLRGCSFPEFLRKKLRTSKLLFGNSHLKIKLAHHGLFSFVFAASFFWEMANWSNLMGLNFPSS